MPDAAYGMYSASDNVSLVSPLGLAMLLLCSLFLLFMKRKHALWPILIMVFFVSQAQKIVIFSLDFNQMRIMALVGLLRVLLMGEMRGIKHHKLDYFVIGYALVVSIFHVIRDGGGVLVYELGNTFDYILPYIVFRVLIQNYEDLIYAIKILSILTSVVAVFFLNEHFTGRNIFSVFGGVPEYTAIRDDRLRCQGAFVHPIIAGVYFAVILPLFVALFWHKHKVLAVTGAGGAILIVIACASSTPVFAVMSAFLGGVFFPIREIMAVIRWSVYSALVFLHMVMNAPVWNLIARVSATGSSDSWYRYMLIDVTIHNFMSWWLIGISDSSFVAWYMAYGPVDITDQFVNVALSGGLLGLVLYIYTIALGFGAVGRVWRRMQHERSAMVLSWAMGCSLFAMIMSFIGVSVWGQMTMLWAMILAMIASMDNHYKYNEVDAVEEAASQ